MGSYAAYLRERLAHGFTFNFFDGWNGFQRHYRNSHGADRFDFANDPFYGRIMRYNAERQKAQDQYDNTGRDQNYASNYSNPGFPFVNDTMNGLGVSPAKMAKTLGKMYGCEVLLDLNKERKELEQMRAVNRYNYMVGSHALAEHWMDYQRMKNR